MGHENLTCGVEKPGPATATSAPKETRILMQQGGKDRFGHVVANHEIAVCRPEVTRIAGNALSQGGVGIRQLTIAREKCGKRERSAIESVLGGNLKFRGCRNRLIIRQLGRRPEVGDDPEDSLAVFVGRVLGRRVLGCSVLRHRVLRIGRAALLAKRSWCQASKCGKQNRQDRVRP